MNLKCLVLLLISIVAGIANAHTASAGVPQGVWLIKGEAAVQIFDCSGLLCGRILWLQVSLLKKRFGHGIGLAMKATVDGCSLIEERTARLRAGLPACVLRAPGLRVTQLRIATTRGSTTAVQVWSLQAVQAARRS